MSETTTAPPLAWSRAFPATPAQVREARRFLTQILDGRPAADDAVLCLSEMAANAILHSNSRKPGGHFTVRAEMLSDRLRVEVHDDGGPWTVPPPDGLRHGHGLHIISQLARTWGITGDAGTGWTVWFTINLSAPPATTSPHPGGETTMTQPSPPAPADEACYNTEDMRAIQAGLTASGLTTHLTDARAGLDLTATFHLTGKHDAEFWIDEAGYAELRYWLPPGTPPAQVTATALQALQAVTSPLPGTSPHPA
jgi:serine/threonine-protein kinase RsbW